MPEDDAACREARRQAGRGQSTVPEFAELLADDPPIDRRPYRSLAVSYLFASEYREEAG